MVPRFSDVKVCIWDFDGTFFKPIPALNDAIIEADYRVVMAHTNWSRKKTVEEFHKVYKVVTPSSTETAARLANISLREAAIECEHYKDRTKYLVRDDKLPLMFARLSMYTHYILANGIREKIIPALEVLGISIDTFRDIVTSEIVGVNKPQPQGFLYVMKESGLPANAHIMIGDREAVDLEPAKKLGMHTILVWSDSQSSIADVTLRSVYDIAGVLG